MAKQIRVLVFGTAGVGKTSLCNTLSGETADVGKAVKGITFDTQVFEFQQNDQIISLTDTVGLNESELGSVPAEKAFEKLVKLVKQSEEGYNLLIHVFRIPRFSGLEVDNYQLFYEQVIGSRIPIILVATGCENIDPMSNWKNENEADIRKFKFDYKDIICTCFEKGGRFEEALKDLREESRQAVIKAIFDYAAEESIKIYDDQSSQGFFGSVAEVVKRVWDWFSRRLGNSDEARKIAKGILMDYFGMDEETAEMTVNFIWGNTTSK